MQAQDEIIELLEKNIVFYDNIGSGPIAQMPRADYDQALAKLKEEPEPSEFTKNVRDTLRIMSNDGKFHRKVMEKACDIIEQLTDKYDRLDLYNCDMMQKYQNLQADKDKLIEGQQAKKEAGS